MTDEKKKGPCDKKIPDGDDRERLVCGDCGFIDYRNPRIIVGAVCTWDDKILLCRRAIEPRKGFWTLPAGYMEEGESVEEGAARETMEEAGASIDIDSLLAVYSLPHLSHVQMFCRGKMTSPAFDAGAESLEVRLFEWKDIPWSDLAFQTVHKALSAYDQTKHLAGYVPFRETLRPPPPQQKAPAP